MLKQLLRHLAVLTLRFRLIGAFFLVRSGLIFGLFSGFLIHDQALPAILVIRPASTF